MLGRGTAAIFGAGVASRFGRKLGQTDGVTRVGAERSDARLVWPSRLIPAACRLVYLDLNQWIALAKANTGHRDGVRWRSALEVMRERLEGWTYVISLPLIMEITGNLRRSQREDLADVIEELTDYACVMPLTTIAALEFESSLAALTPITERFAPVPLLGNGIGQAFGVRGGFRVRDRDGNDVTERARMEAPVGPDEFDRRFAEAERQLNRSVIGGPRSDEEEQELRAMGWDPSAAFAGAERRAQQERELAVRLDAEPRWRRGRLRDLIAARYVALEMEEVRKDAVAAHGLRLPAVLGDLERARAFTDSMPAADVWITLRTAKHRNASSVWKPNDIFDIDALSVAAAYCEVVVTERHSAHVLTNTGTDARHRTTVLTDLGLLADHLIQLA